MIDAAKKRMTDSTVRVTTWEEFIKASEDRKLMLTEFCGDETCEDKIKEKTGGITSRCIPLDSNTPSGNCVHCGKPAKHFTYFAKAY